MSMVFLKAQRTQKARITEQGVAMNPQDSDPAGDSFITEQGVLDPETWDPQDAPDGVPGMIRVYDKHGRRTNQVLNPAAHPKPMVMSRKGLTKAVNAADQALIEDLAQAIHNIWMGWAVHAVESVDATTRRRWKPMMQPYSNLPEAEKQKDRVEAIALLDIVREEGLHKSRAVLRKSKLSSDLQSRVRDGSAHWVTIKEGPLEGRHLLIDGKRPAKGTQSHGKILAGHGIPAHVIEKITGATHAHHLEHVVSNGPADDLSAKREAHAKERAHYAEAFKYSLPDAQERLARLEALHPSFTGVQQQKLESVRATVRQAEALTQGSGHATPEEVKRLANHLDGAGPQLQALITAAEKPRESPVAGPYTERDAEDRNRYSHYTVSHHDLNREHQTAMATYRKQATDQLGDALPEDVEHALSRLADAYVQGLRDNNRATAMAPGAYVVGPSNYKGRHDKADAIRERSYARIDEAKEAFERAIKRAADAKQGKTPVQLGESDAVVKIRQKIDRLEQERDTSKQINKIMRTKDSDTEKIAKMHALGVEENAIKEAMTPTFGQRGVPTFHLANLGAEIRRQKERLAAAEKLSQVQSSSHVFAGGTIEDNADANRVQIFFDQKPSAEMIGRLKSRGFKWAPSVGAWQRQRSGAHVLTIAQQIVGAPVTKSRHTARSARGVFVRAGSRAHREGDLTRWQKKTRGLRPNPRHRMQGNRPKGSAMPGEIGPGIASPMSESSMQVMHAITASKRKAPQPGAGFDPRANLPGNGAQLVPVGKPGIFLYKSDPQIVQAVHDYKALLEAGKSPIVALRLVGQHYPWVMAEETPRARDWWAAVRRADLQRPAMYVDEDTEIDADDDESPRRKTKPRAVFWREDLANLGQGLGTDTGSGGGGR